jgi:hypothetical protein
MAPTKNRRDAASRRSYVPVKYETDLTRRRNVKEQRRSILVVTNGERTEVDYFEGLRFEPQLCATLRVKFEGVAPAALPAKAAFLRDSNDYDAVWVVCDVDQFDVALARQEAAVKGVGLALSNPCFEVWLLLHVSNKCGGFNNCDQVKNALRKQMPGWDKTRLNFADFRDFVMSAVERAKRLGDTAGDNPSTAVWRVVEDAYFSGE